MHTIHPDAPKLDVTSKLLSQLYLHTYVREKGGAYGGYAGHDSGSGILTFNSYRDPQTINTVNVYENAGQWLLQGDNITQTKIEEALLSLFSSIDAPKTPATKGSAQWLTGITDEERQRYRDALLSSNVNDIKYIAEKYLNSDRLKSANISIVGKNSDIPKEIRSSQQWKVKQLDLALGGEGEDNIESS